MKGSGGGRVGLREGAVHLTARMMFWSRAAMMEPAVGAAGRSGLAGSGFGPPQPVLAPTLRGCAVSPQGT